MFIGQWIWCGVNPLEKCTHFVGMRFYLHSNNIPCSMSELNTLFELNLAKLTFVSWRQTYLIHSSIQMDGSERDGGSAIVRLLSFAQILIVFSVVLAFLQSLLGHIVCPMFTKQSETKTKSVNKLRHSNHASFTYSFALKTVHANTLAIESSHWHVRSSCLFSTDFFFFYFVSVTSSVSPPRSSSSTAISMVFSMCEPEHSWDEGTLTHIRYWVLPIPHTGQTHRKMRSKKNNNKRKRRLTTYSYKKKIRWQILKTTTAAIR